MSRSRSAPFRPGPLHRRARRLLAATAVAGATVTLVVGPAAAQTTGSGFPGMPGGAGALTGRSGSTLQIQSAQGTTSKVIVTSSTEYRKVEETDASAITEGACVRISGDGTADDGVTATEVTVLDDDQACASNRGRGPSGQGGASFQPPNGGSLPSGATLPNGGSLPNGGTFPQGAAPPDGATPGGGFGGGISGKVKSVDGDTIVVTARVPQQPANGSAGGSNGTGGTGAPGALKLKKQKVTVTLTDTTTVRHTVAATESALVTGVCVSTVGSSDSVGTVTATTVTVSEPVDGVCAAAFGPGGGLGMPPGTPGSGSSGSGSSGSGSSGSSSGSGLT